MASRGTRKKRTKPKIRRREEMIKIRAELNRIGASKIQTAIRDASSKRYPKWMNFYLC